MQARNLMRRLLRSQSGNVLAMGAAAMPLLVGSAALALDTIQMALWKRQLQRAADSAALAGAYAVSQEKAAGDAVIRDLQLNPVSLLGAPVVENAPTAGAFKDNPDAVRVVLTAQRSMPFMSFFDNTPPTITVEATAAGVYQGEYCMVSLEEGSVTGITFTGSAVVKLGCGVISNARGTNAVFANGSARVTANPVAAVGGVPASTGYVEPTKLMPYTLRQDDPYAALPREPSPPSNCAVLEGVSVLPNRTHSIANSPETSNQYCVRGGLDVKGTLNLAPGTYYVDGSAVHVGAQGALNGTGVTIILTSSTPTSASSFATLDIHAGGAMNLTSPTSGTYKGILFYGDPRSPYQDTIFNGNSASVVEGGFYFPSQQLIYDGKSGMQIKCVQMVAKRLTFAGTSDVANECPTGSGGKAFPSTFVRLVA